MIKFPLSVVIAAVDKWTAPLAKMQAKVNKTFAPLRELGTKLHALGEASGLRKLGSAFAEVGSAIGNVIRTIARFALVVGGAIAGAIAAVYSLVLGTARAGDQALETARKIGIGVEAYQELAYAAKLSGVDQATLTSTLSKLSRNMGLVALGNRAAAQGFRRLGVDVLDSNKKLRPVEDVLADVADALNKLDDPLKRNAIGAMIFGKSTAELNTLLKDGSKGLRDAAKEARRLGVVLSQDAAEASDEFMDAQERVKSALAGVRNTIGVALIPALTKLAEKLTAFLTAHREEIKSWAERFAKGLPERLDKLGRQFSEIVEDLRPLVRAIGRLIERFGAVKVAIAALSAVLVISLVPAVFSTIAALATLSTALVSTPAGWVVLAFAACALAGAAFAYVVIKIGQHWEELWIAIRLYLAVGKALLVNWVNDLADSIVSPFRTAFAWLEDKFRGLESMLPDWLRDSLGLSVKVASSGALGPPAAGAIAASSGGKPGGQSSLKVEFVNAPKGTRVSEASSGGPDIDLSLGYSLAGGN